MSFQFHQVSYIASVDLDTPSAVSNVDYKQDFVSALFNEIRQKFREVASKDQSSLVVSPAINMHYFLDAEVAEGYRNFCHGMNRFMACSEGWSSEHSVGPSTEQFKSALLAIANLIVTGIKPPSPMLLDDGTVGAYWRNGRKYVSIDFDTDNQHPWAGTDGDHYWSGIWQLSEKLPELLNSELKTITER